MISVRRVDLRRCSPGECWRMAGGPLAAAAVFLRRLLGLAQAAETVGPCYSDFPRRVGEGQAPAPLRQACRDVAEEGGEGGLRPLFCYAYPPFLGDTDLGAAFLSADGRTAAFLHYCGARWPATFFYCVSRRAGGGLLVTTDMREEANLPPELAPAYRPYYRYYPGDVLEHHAERLRGEQVQTLGEPDVGPLIADVQNCYARHRVRGR